MPDRDYSHRALIDKLGVKPGARVGVMGVDDARFERELVERDAQRVQADADVTLFGVAERDELAGIGDAWSRTAPRGALWVVYPRGVRAVTEAEVRQAGLALGIVDNKIVRFSDTHTAIRFVPRRA